jgi:hypothetical protein
VWVDCSVLPFTTWADDGAPDYRHRTPTPVRVNHPAGPVWELPLSFGFTRKPFPFWAKVCRFADSGFGRALRLTGVFDRLGVVSRAWLNFENPLGERMLRFLHVLRADPPPFVSFTLHSSSLLPGGSPYCPTDEDVKKLLTNLETVLTAVAGWPEFAPATMTEIAHTLEAAHPS